MKHDSEQQKADVKTNVDGQAEPPFPSNYLVIWQVLHKALGHRRQQCVALAARGHDSGNVCCNGSIHRLLQVLDELGPSRCRHGP